MSGSGRPRRLLVDGVVLLGMVLALVGCTTLRETAGGWFGATAMPAPTPVQTPIADVAGTFYSGVEGLTVYSEPSKSSTVVGALRLYDKVTRTKRERGYAYVTSAMSGVSGWVSNAQLLWRVPIAAPSPAAAAVPAEIAPVESAPAAPSPLSVVPQAEATAQEAGAPARPTPTPAGVAPSIFDAY